MYYVNYRIWKVKTGSLCRVSTLFLSCSNVANRVRRHKITRFKRVFGSFKRTRKIRRVEALHRKTVLTFLHVDVLVNWAESNSNSTQWKYYCERSKSQFWDFIFPIILEVPPVGSINSYVLAPEIDFSCSGVAHINTSCPAESRPRKLLAYYWPLPLRLGQTNPFFPRFPPGWDFFCTATCEEPPTWHVP